MCIFGNRIRSFFPSFLTRIYNFQPFSTILHRCWCGAMCVRGTLARLPWWPRRLVATLRTMISRRTRREGGLRVLWWAVCAKIIFKIAEILGKCFGDKVHYFNIFGFFEILNFENLQDFLTKENSSEGAQTAPTPCTPTNHRPWCCHKPPR